MKQSKLQITRLSIIKFFRASQQKIWTRKQIANVLLEMREEWHLAQRTSINDFLDFLVSETDFVQSALEFPSVYTWVERFWWGQPTIYEVAMQIHPKGYFSHHTAVYLNKLTKKEPGTAYFNIEQTATGTSNGRLYQKNITAAFQRPARISNNRSTYNDKTICLLSGKNTGNLEVGEMRQGKRGITRLTGVERTLIDCAVRPIYSGGPLEVLRAYRNARSKVSLAKMADLLEKLNYTYPYHQVVGFYLDRTGSYQETETGLFRHRKMMHDFYLDYQMTHPNYSQKWRLYYPAELDAA